MHADAICERVADGCRVSRYKLCTVMQGDAGGFRETGKRQSDGGLPSSERDARSCTRFLRDRQSDALFP